MYTPWAISHARQGNGVADKMTPGGALCRSSLDYDTAPKKSYSVIVCGWYRYAVSCATANECLVIWFVCSAPHHGDYIWWWWYAPLFLIWLLARIPMSLTFSGGIIASARLGRYNWEHSSVKQTKQFEGSEGANCVTRKHSCDDDDNDDGCLDAFQTNI